MTFDGSGGGRQLVEPLVKTDLLVLDELGAGKPSPWVMDLLYFLVNTRYLERRITLFTTNYSDFPKEHEESLANRISARLRSRLYEMCIRVELRGEDYRKYQLSKIRERPLP
jgi:DNA replication protein DnaC